MDGNYTPVEMLANFDKLDPAAQDSILRVLFTGVIVGELAIIGCFLLVWAAKLVLR